MRRRALLIFRSTLYKDTDFIVRICHYARIHHVIDLTFSGVVYEIDVCDRSTDEVNCQV